MTTPLYNLIPLNCGHCSIGENHLLGDPYSDDNRVGFTLYAFLADGGPSRRVLVDLGPVGLPYINDMFRRFRFFRDLPGDPDAIRQPSGNIFDWLDRLEIKPEEVNHVVLTHLHSDHHGLTDATDAGGILQLPNAVVHVSRIGWENNLQCRRDGQWNSYVDYAFSDWLTEAGQTGRAVFHDNAEIVPGIDTIYLNGHEICSQAVRVQTVIGPAIVTSDEIYQYELLRKGILGRLRTTTENLRRATDLMVDLALDGAILLPCHEPMMAEFYAKHGPRWLEAIKPVSDAAARGYRAADKQAIG